MKRSKWCSTLDNIGLARVELALSEFDSEALPLSYKPMIALDIGFQHDPFSEDYFSCPYPHCPQCKGRTELI